MWIQKFFVSFKALFDFGPMNSLLQDRDRLLESARLQILLMHQVLMLAHMFRQREIFGGTHHYQVRAGTVCFPTDILNACDVLVKKIRQCTIQGSV